MPPAPVPLTPEQQLKYDDLYQLLGKKRADDYAVGVSRPAPTPAPVVTPPAPEPVPAEPAQPRIAPVSGRIVTGPDGRPTFVPVGMEPPPTPMPEPREARLERPNIPTIRLDQETLAQRAIEVRTITKQQQGMSYEDARKQATEEITKMRETPRTVEYGAPKAPPGYSELAVRGEELLPKLSAGEVALEAIKPQVIETAEQAEGRRRFERAKNDAKAELERRSKESGVTLDQQVELEKTNNVLRANQMAKEMYPPEKFTEGRNEILASLNAPLYAAVAEFRGTPPGEVFSKFATDTLRGLTQEERYGRLVETRGAAALRNIGGLTRVGVEALRTPVEYVTSELAAATSGVPGVTGEQLRAEREREVEAGPRRVATPGVEYEEGFAPRQRIEVAEPGLPGFVKEVGYQVATGRSAIDDWYDAGVGKTGAAILGITTEIGLPMTPAGWVTDVPKAIGLGKVVSTVGNAAEAAARAPRLYSLLSETASSAEKLGLAMERPSFWKTMTAATDARVATATNLADELGDAAALERALRGKEDIGKILTDAQAAPRRSAIVNSIIDGINIRGINIADTDEIIKSGIIQAKLSDVSKQLGRTGAVAAGDVAPDILRNTYAAALKDTNQVGKTSERAVRAAIAETLEKVPDSGWSFVTPRLAVRKATIESPRFQKVVAGAVKDATRLNPDISVAEVQRVVEETIKREFRGASEALAEPVAVAPPRAPSLLPEAPRGGLERIATPEPRRVAVIEAGQTARDVVRAIPRAVTEAGFQAARAVGAGAPERFLKRILDNPKNYMSNTFSGSSFLGTLRGTLDEALSARIPVEMRDFIETTSSQINSLSSTVGAGAAKGGPIINAMRVQGGLSDYLDARVFADVTDPESLSALSLRAAYEPGGLKPALSNMTPAQREVVASAIERMTRAYFGTDAIGQVLSPGFAQALSDASLAAARTSDTTIDALAKTIETLRDGFPVLKGRGRVTAAFEDDLASAALEYIMNKEAKVIWGKNFDTFFPGVADARVTVNDIVDKFDTLLSSHGVSDATINSAKSLLYSRMTADRVLQEAIEQEAFIATKQARIDSAIDFVPPGQGYNYSAWTDTLPDGLVDELKALTADTREKFWLEFDLLDAGIADGPVDAMVQYAAQNRIIRSVDEADVMQWVNNTMRLPVTSTERKIIESLVGPIDDLAKGTGALADNLKAVYRNPKNGLGVSFTGIVQSFINFARTASRTGLTVGTILPNIKFHATNYLSAPFLLSMTSPGLAVRATASEFLPMMFDLGATNGTWVRRVAQNPATADNVAFTSRAGVPYTYKQLDDFMSKNHFGMTQSVNDFGNGFAADVRIALGAGPSGKSASLYQKSKDRALQLWNLEGTNYSTAFASYVDTGWRKNVFLAALKSGETPEAALQVARNATLDYGRIPGSLRTAAARYMTFFSWFAVSNAEAFSLLFRPKALEAVARVSQAQRTFHRGWGEWDNADDNFKKRIFSIELGEYDDVPAFYTGFVNPSLDPLVNQSTLVLSLATLAGRAIGAGPETQGDLLDIATDAGSGFAKSIIEQSFTPELGYLKAIGYIGEERKGLVVPWRQIAWHQAQGPAHFAAWMADNGVVPVPVDERRPGEPTFYGQQYKYKDDKARNRAATLDAIQVFTGVGRMLNDYSAMGAIALPGDGVDMKRYDRMTLGILQYFFGTTLSKGTTEYEQTRRAIEQTNRELREITKEK